jgi:hypothetical protein
MMALIEGLFGVTLCLSLVMGSVDIGLALQAWATGGKSVRDAARYLGRLGNCTDLALANARNLAVYGNTAGAGSPLVQGWTTDMVQISCGARVTVTSSLQRGRGCSVVRRG